MSRDALHESLSALMDGEASELEVRRLLRDSADDGELRERWRHWHVARAAMHDELQAPKLDLASRVSAALADEPALVAQVPWYARMPGRVAVAASVTLAVLAGLQFAPLGEQAAPQLAQQEIPTLTIPGRLCRGRRYWRAISLHRPARTCSRYRPKLCNLRKTVGTRNACRCICTSTYSKCRPLKAMLSCHRRALLTLKGAD